MASKEPPWWDASRFRAEFVDARPIAPVINLKAALLVN